MEKQSKTQTVTKTMVELAYEYARGMFRSGDKELYKQLLSLYLDKVIVYYDHIEFYLNTLPANILRGEIDRSLGIGEEETLVEYMMRCDPTIADTIKSLDKENRRKEKGVTARGGNSFFYITKEEFLRNLPLKILNVSNPTFRVCSIGRNRIKRAGEE